MWRLVIPFGSKISLKVSEHFLFLVPNLLCHNFCGVRYMEFFFLVLECNRLMCICEG